MNNEEVKTKINQTIGLNGTWFFFEEDRDTYPASQSNQITKEYYDFLVGEINRNVIKKVVCRVEDDRFGKIFYYLVSER